MAALPYYDISARSTEGEGVSVTVEFQPGSAFDQDTRDALLGKLADAIADLPTVAQVTAISERSASTRTVR